MSLWLRCKTEYNRTKTIERATMQLNNILKSYYGTALLSCPLLRIHYTLIYVVISMVLICIIDDGNRNEYFFQISYPAIWNIKREIGKFQL